MFTVFPQIIAFSQLIAYLSNRPLEEIFKIMTSLDYPNPPPPPTTTFDMIASFYPAELISDDSSSDTEDILTYKKINQGTKFGTLKEPMFIV